MVFKKHVLVKLMSQPKLPILQACNKPNPTKATVKIKPYKAMDSFRRWSLTSTAAWIKFVVLESAAERISACSEAKKLVDIAGSKRFFTKRGRNRAL